MKITTLDTIPSRKSYDVVIIGGANMGSSVACFLGLNEDFNGASSLSKRI